MPNTIRFEGEPFTIFGSQTENSSADIWEKFTGLLDGSLGTWFQSRQNKLAADTNKSIIIYVVVGLIVLILGLFLIFKK